MRALLAGMSVMISDRDIIRVHLSLEVPQAIADMLDRRISLQDDEFYALEAGVSEMTPERALLTMACAARYMALEKTLDESLTVSLSLQADSAFDDYAPRFLAGLKQTMKSTCSGYMVYMQEDFESFADIFSLVVDLSGGNEALRDIATILSDQALAHAESMDHEGDLFDYDEGGTDLDLSAPVYPLTDNVILFPKR